MEPFVPPVMDITPPNNATAIIIMTDSHAPASSAVNNAFVLPTVIRKADAVALAIALTKSEAFRTECRTFCMVCREATIVRCMVARVAMAACPVE